MNADTVTKISDLGERAALFKERVASACISAGRSESEIKIVAATKCVPAEVVKALPHYGITDAGENRVQEFLTKYEPSDGLNWHIIGALQTNKVKYVIGKTALIQSVDRTSLADEIERLSGKLGIVTDILIEVNIGGEQNKSGIRPDELDGFAAYIAEKRRIRLKGIMSVPPVNAQYKAYEELYGLYVKTAQKYKSVNTLSVGMSADFETAIKCGANMIRPGRILFGERYYGAKTV